jgi:hypothetical protein
VSCFACRSDMRLSAAYDCQAQAAPPPDAALFRGGSRRVQLLVEARVLVLVQIQRVTC